MGAEGSGKSLQSITVVGRFLVYSRSRFSEPFGHLARALTKALPGEVCSCLSTLPAWSHSTKNSCGRARNVAKQKPSRFAPLAQPAEQRGPLRTGRIVNLLLGQGHGFIRLADRRQVFFHRSDLRDGTGFGDLAVGEVLTFELLEDPISGPRALRVGRRKRQG